MIDVYTFLLLLYIIIYVHICTDENVYKPSNTASTEALRSSTQKWLSSQGGGHNYDRSSRLRPFSSPPFRSEPSLPKPRLYLDHYSPSKMPKKASSTSPVPTFGQTYGAFKASQDLQALTAAQAESQRLYDAHARYVL